MAHKRQLKAELEEKNASENQKRRNVGVHKLIVGVDYGTTFTGVSWASTARKGIENITVITTWPGAGRSATIFKTPSRIAYPERNYKISEKKWGFQVQAGMISHSWTKLLLDKNSQMAEFDDQTLSFQKESGMPVLNLPPGKDAVSVVADFLEGVYKHTMSILEQRISSDVLAITPIEFWFTMPAIWSDAAKHSTRDAAMRAGFGSRLEDEIFMIPEPEAAAITALTEHSKNDTLSIIKPFDGVLVCDCGGGTVDITTYRILKTVPELVFEELCPGAGAKCGSTTIDRKLHSLMVKRFGDIFRDLPPKLKGPGSKFMDEFETIKHDFGHDGGNDDGIFELPLDIETKGSIASRYFDSDERLVMLSSKDLRGLFDPVVENIKALIHSQLESANRQHKNSAIKTIILVGGFGNSQYLLQELMKEFSAGSKVQIIVPENAQAAIVRGAVLRGLEGLRPVARRSRLHYGFEINMPFRKGKDEECHSFIDVFDGRKYSSGRMEWMVKKNEKLRENSTKKKSLTFSDEELPTTLRVELYSCALDEAPERVEAAGIDLVGHLVVNFTESDWSALETKVRYGGAQIFRMNYEAHMCFSGAEGVLQFSAMSNKRKLGETHIDFSAN